MELNKEIHEIILDAMYLAQEKNWSKADRDTRAVYDTFRVQNIVKKLNIDNVSKSVAKRYAEFCVRCDREGLPLLELDGYIKQYCC